MLLVKCVHQHDSHKAPYGKKVAAFEVMKESFLGLIPEHFFIQYLNPSLKSVRQWFRPLEDKRREHVKVNEENQVISRK